MGGPKVSTAALGLRGLCLGLSLGLVTMGAPGLVVAESSKDFVLTVTTDLRDRLRAEFANTEPEPARVQDFIRQEVGEHFDVELVARRVLAKNWRKANAEQRQGFIDAFGLLLLRTYASSLLNYLDVDVTYQKTRVRKANERESVRVLATNSGGLQVPVTYEVRKDDDKWRIYDVVVDGVSVVATYRSAFASIVRRQGVDGLIEQLRDGNATGTVK